MYLLTTFFFIALILALPLFLMRRLESFRLMAGGSWATCLTRFILAWGHHAKWWRLPDSRADTMRFFNDAKEFAEQGTFSPQWTSIYLYENVLSMIFRVSGAHYFIGSLTSILAFGLFFVVAARFIDALARRYNEALRSVGLGALMLFSFLPSTLTYSTLIFREPWMLLFYAMAVFGLYTIVFREKIRGFGFYFIGFIGGMFLHKGLILYALKTPYFLLIPNKRPALTKDKIRPALYKIGLFIVALSLVWGIPVILKEINPNIRFSYAEAMAERGIFSDNGLAKQAEIYQSRQTKSRTHYGVNFRTSTTKDIIVTGLPQALSYMFRPLPHEIDTFMDFYAATEGLLRLLCVIATIWGWFYVSYPEKYALIFLTLNYALLSIIWAAGTSSWGTAIRHHNSNLWLLILIGFWSGHAVYCHFKPAQK